MNPKLIPIIFRKKKGIIWDLDLDFTSGVLDPRITFSRTSPGTMFNSIGQLVYSPSNLLLNSSTLSTQTVSTGFSSGIPLTISFTGTGSITLSGGGSGTLNGTGANDRVSLGFTASSASVTFTVSGDVRLAQLELTGADSPKSYNATAGTAYHGPRFTFDPTTRSSIGILLEVARTNVITNSIAAGGNASTLPTGWVYGTSTLTDVTTSYAYGTEDGIPYMDITMAGTNATGSAAFPMISFGQYAATNNSVWASSVFVKKVSGSGSLSDFVLIQRYRDSGSAQLTQSSSVALSSSSNLRETRVAALLTAPAASTAFVQGTITGTIAAGATLDLTLRIGLPQTETGSFPTSAIPTATVAVTRTSDNANVTGTSFSSWFSHLGGSYYFEGIGHWADPGFGSAIVLGTGVNGEEVNLYLSSSATAAVSISTGSVSQANINSGGTVTITTTRKCAWRAFTNDAAFSSQGAAASTDSAVTLPVGLDRMSIGTNVARGNASWASGVYSRFRFTRQNISNAELQAMTL